MTPIALYSTHTSDVSPDLPNRHGGRYCSQQRVAGGVATGMTVVTVTHQMTSLEMHGQ